MKLIAYVYQESNAFTDLYIKTNISKFCNPHLEYILGCPVLSSGALILLRLR